jgi:hypothetical protein
MIQWASGQSRWQVLLRMPPHGRIVRTSAGQVPSCVLSEECL